MDADHYDEFADAYEATNASSLLNAHCERPAMIALVGDARGRRILDAGCGSGALSAALRAEGAVVTGVDGSPAMLELARTRLGDGVPLRLVDLAGPLPFEDDSFDDVVASLVLHYLGDWQAVLAEMRRVLRPGGRLVVSVNHPFVRTFTHPDEDYFAVRQYSDDFEFDGEPAVLTFWHRPLHTMMNDFITAGFTIDRVEEPPPSPSTPRDLMPPRIASGERTAFFGYIFFVLTAR